MHVFVWPVSSTPPLSLFSWLAPGSDFVETNTFSGTVIAQADYGLEHMVYQLNRESARIANEACREAEEAGHGPKFVAGAIGPTNRTLSISPNVEDPGYREVSFKQMVDAYAEQVRCCIKKLNSTLIILF